MVKIDEEKGKLQRNLTGEKTIKEFKPIIILDTFWEKITVIVMKLRVKICGWISRGFI